MMFLWTVWPFDKIIRQHTRYYRLTYCWLPLGYSCKLFFFLVIYVFVFFLMIVKSVVMTNRMAMTPIALTITNMMMMTTKMINHADFPSHLKRVVVKHRSTWTYLFSVNWAGVHAARHLIFCLLGRCLSDGVVSAGDFIFLFVRQDNSFSCLFGRTIHFLVCWARRFIFLFVCLLGRTNYFFVCWSWQFI